MKHKIMLLAGVVCVLLSGREKAFSQGSLTPPGAPAPTMKTLGQIEPRTPISSVPYIISAPGSYYVVSNLTGVASQSGITINSGNVALDLNGFALLGVPNSLDGVYISTTFTNIIIRNGTVSGWGANGVNGYTFGFPRNVIYEHLTVSGNANGIEAEAESIIRDCTVINNNDYGIFTVGGLITGCIARENRGYGIYAQNSSVRSCSVQVNATGLYADDSTVADSDIVANTTNGMTIGSMCHIVNNRIAENLNPSFGIGLTITSEQNYVAGNTIVNNNYAIVATAIGATNNCIIQNHMLGNPNSALLLDNIFPNVEISAAEANNFTNNNPFLNIIFP